MPLFVNPAKCCTTEHENDDTDQPTNDLFTCNERTTAHNWNVRQNFSRQQKANFNYAKLFLLSRFSLVNWNPD